MVTIVFLLISVILFIKMWIMAYMTGAIPDPSWYENMAKHGPWRRICALKEIWYQILDIQFLASIAAIISIIIKPNIKNIITAIIAIALMFLFFHTHYWLVD